MSIEEQSLPDDLAACQALIETQLAIIARLQTQLDQLQGTAGQQTETIESQQQLIDKLRHELDLFKRYIFGRRRERFVDDPRQGKLFEIDEELTGPAELADQEDDPAESSPKHSRGGHGRRPLPDFLPREEVIHELNKGERKCPCCGTLRIKVSEEISEQLEFQPASLFVVRHVRYIYTCQEDACEANMTTAPKPPQPIEKGLPGPGLLSFVITSKLADHLPLNRQEDILTRNGIHIHRSTLGGWMAASAELVTPLYELMVQQTLASKVLGTDDTKAPFLDPPLEHTRTGYFWAYFGDESHPFVVYDFTVNHSRAGPEKFLQGFEGYLQGDAYSGYLEIAKQSKGVIRHVGCWSHARRYFDRARETAPTRAVHEALAYIQRLYDVEDEAAELSSEARLSLRREKSVPLLDAFDTWLKAAEQTALPKSPLGEAISYALNQWESLRLYTTDGDIPIDNNRVERALRAQVLGRLNWKFLGSETGGHTAAVLYSLVSSCKRLRIDPFAYLQDVLTRLPSASDTELEELLPDRWIKAHPQHRLAYRQKEADQATRRRRERRTSRRQLAQAQATQ